MEGVGQFNADELRLLGQADEVRVETARQDGAPRRTITWIMVDGSTVYLRSVRGAQGLWYQALSRDGRGRLLLDDQAWSIRVEPVTESAEIERVSAAVRGKYERRWPGPTASMLEPATLPTTLRVERDD
jgi:hypothetical protein